MILDYALNRYRNTLSELTVFEDQMMKNIYQTNGIIFSQQVLNLLIRKGFSREDAYDLVQQIAMESYHNQQSFKELLLKNDIIIKHTSVNEIEACFDIHFYLRNVEEIYKRVGLVK
ncbi:MAG: hypothetical protein ACVCEJ_11040 [Candidatus Izemoplasmataceae bacterium]